MVPKHPCLEHGRERKPRVSDWGLASPPIAARVDIRGGFWGISDSLSEAVNARYVRLRRFVARGAGHGVPGVRSGAAGPGGGSACSLPDVPRDLRAHFSSADYFQLPAAFGSTPVTLGKQFCQSAVAVCRQTLVASPITLVARYASAQDHRIFVAFLWRRTSKRDRISRAQILLALRSIACYLGVLRKYAG